MCVCVRFVVAQEEIKSRGKKILNYAKNEIKKLWGKVANCCLALQYEHFCVVFFCCFACRLAAGGCLCKTAAIADVFLDFFRKSTSTSSLSSSHRALLLLQVLPLDVCYFSHTNVNSYSTTVAFSLSAL